MRLYAPYMPFRCTWLAYIRHYSYDPILVQGLVSYNLEP